MKQETKELIKWIKEACEAYVYASKDFKENLYRDKTCDEAITFLDSLPEIESHLCCGGYIQDGFEKPCRAGDKIKDKEGAGELYWSKTDFRFYIRRDSGELDLIHCPFIKVE